MRTAVIPLVAAFELVGRIAVAQSESGPVAQLRACSLMERAERLECLDRLSRDIAAAPDRPARSGGDWMISETTSPVDYTPIVTAVAVSRGGSDGSLMQLAISCRGGRTELVVEGPAITGKGDDFAISYRIDGNEPVQIAAGPPSFGTGAAFKGDIVRLLQSLPEGGGITVRISPRKGDTRERTFSLNGLKSVREKLATACKWPQAAAQPRN
jgi:hypothetical protein